jgi:hypothetical protein
MLNWGEILSQLQSSGVTACFTVLAGVLVYVLGQWVVKFFIEPIQSQAKLIVEIAFSLTFYANMYGLYGKIDNKELHDISTTLRKHASDLQASVWSIKSYWFWQLLGVVPKKKNVSKASGQLIGMSNSILNKDDGGKYYDFVDRREKEIRSLLGLK